MSIKVTLNKKETTRLSIVMNIITLIVILVIHCLRDFFDINFRQLGFFLIYYFLIYIPAHEIIHVLAAHMFRSGKAKFGFKLVHKVLPVAYVHIGGHYKVSQLRLVYLMPLLALNFIPLCLFILDRNLLTFIYFSFFFNVLGASGDLYIFYKSLKYSGKLKAVDLSDDIGFEILEET